MILADGEYTESSRKGLYVSGGSVRQLEEEVQEVPGRSHPPPLLPVQIDRVAGAADIEAPL